MYLKTHKQKKDGKVNEYYSENVDAIPLKLSGIELEKPRAFGDCWLGCEVWDQLGLDTFWSGRIDTSKSPAPYSKVLKLLTVNRLIKARL